MRKDWNTYWMDMAFTAATRATCPRRSVGCVIVNYNHVVSMGYNGAPQKQDQCDEVGCLLEDGHCIRTVHAEANALLRAAPEALAGALIYVTDWPCMNCARLIANTRIARLFYAWNSRPYGRHSYSTKLLAHLDPVELRTPLALER